MNSPLLTEIARGTNRFMEMAADDKANISFEGGKNILHKGSTTPKVKVVSCQPY